MNYPNKGVSFEEHQSDPMGGLGTGEPSTMLGGGSAPSLNSYQTKDEKGSLAKGAEYHTESEPGGFTAQLSHPQGLSNIDPIPLKNASAYHMRKEGGPENAAYRGNDPKQRAASNVDQAKVPSVGFANSGERDKYIANQGGDASGAPDVAPSGLAYERETGVMKQRLSDLGNLKLAKM